MSQASSTRLGFLAALAAYVIWGAFPLYYHRLASVPAVEVLCNRVIWSAVFCLFLLALRGKLPELVRAFTTRKTVLGLAASGLCISVNWGSYIWAVGQGQTLDASLAYYAMPLVTLLLGVLLLSEKLTLKQYFAVAVMVAGVALLTVDRGRLPWVVIVLPVSFGLYGLVRKLVAVDAMIGVTVETLLIAPFALAYLLTRPAGGALLSGATEIQLLLLLCGPVTTVPLVMFGYGARHMTLTALGLLQYVNPTLQAAMAVLMLGESLSRLQIVTFSLIWLGLAIYSVPLRRRVAAG